MPGADVSTGESDVGVSEPGSETIVLLPKSKLRLEKSVDDAPAHFRCLTLVASLLV